MNFNLELSQIANVRDMNPMAFNHFIFFGHGTKDDYCPFVGRFDMLGAGGSPLCSFPSDKHYFELLQYLSRAAHPVVLYSDMQYLFQHSGTVGRPGQRVSQDVVDWIRFRSACYRDSAGMFQNAALMAYYGMVGENCSEHTRLGARMKLNGIFELLFGCQDVDFAADCNRGVSAEQISAECWSRGIYAPDGGVGI